MSALAPCPFCGSSNVFSLRAVSTNDFYIHCGGCKTDGPIATRLDVAGAAWNFRAPLPAEQPSNPVPLTDAEILADETLRYHFGLNGGDGPVSPKGWKIINAVARIVGQQTNSKG